MKIEQTAIAGVYVLTPVVHEDERGFFMETYRADELAKAGITDEFIQDNHSLSMQQNTMRGMHFQWEKPMSKLMRVTRGRAFLVAIDLRKDSPTLGKWVGIEASAENKKQLYAPASFARGFQTLTPDVEVEYKCSALYNPDTQGEIAWNDPAIGVEWPIKEAPLTSERNRNSPLLADWLARPESDLFHL
jgi:dTDP-4-dehydrorhamnose 3,5-epimerase